jgi:hypothetical protein
MLVKKAEEQSFVRRDLISHSNGQNDLPILTGRLGRYTGDMPMPLTPAEMDFMTNHVTELHHFDRPMPAHEMLRELWQSETRSWEEWNKAIHTFEYLWQEQSRAENTEFFPYTDNPPVPPLTLPWSSPTEFVTRANQLYPESIYLQFSHNDHPYRYNYCWSASNRRYFGWLIPTFTEEENRFLDAYYQEIQSLSWGPCLEAVLAAGIHPWEVSRLVGYRAGELLFKGEKWPVPVSNPIPPLPWKNKQALELRASPPGKEYPPPSPTEHVSLDRCTMNDQESDFLTHYFREITTLTDGPAHQFIREKGIDPMLMTLFLKTAFFISTTPDRLLSKELPPFHGPWNDREVFLKRLEELIDGDGGVMKSKVKEYVQATEGKQG